MSIGKIAIVTGAGSGIGRAAALALQRVGYAVVLAGRREAELRKTVEFATSGAGELVPLPTDVSKPDSVKDLFEKTKERFGRLDLLFNNAGTSIGGKFADLTDEQWEQAVAVNLSGAFFCARAAFRIMMQQDPRGGRIINNGSISAHVPRPNSAPYTATKHAITGLTKSISLEGRAFDIACGQIDIGNAGTEMTSAMSDGVPQADGSRKPEPVMNVQNAADAVLFMAGLPLDANVQFMTVMATKMPFIGRG